MQKIILLLAALGLAAAGYLFYSKDQGMDDNGVVETPATDEVRDEEAKGDDKEEMMDDINEENDNDEMDDEEVVEEAPAVTEEEAQATDYKDGSYSVTQAYTVPDGTEESISINVTLVNDTVTEVSATYVATAQPTAGWQAKFDGAYKAEVEGKDIDEVSLSRTGGSSLTTPAFNQALEAVKAQAKS